MRITDERAERADARAESERGVAFSELSPTDMAVERSDDCPFARRLDAGPGGCCDNDADVSCSTRLAFSYECSPIL